MEEKKTKRMTRAEAFEYLKGKKVACNGSNEELVQSKLFEVGIMWRNSTTDVVEDAPFLFINPNGITHCQSMEWFYTHEYEKISADDILSIEIVEEEKEPLDRWGKFASRVAKIQEMLEDEEVCIITKGNYLTMTK